MASNFGAPPPPPPPPPPPQQGLNGAPVSAGSNGVQHASTHYAHQQMHHQQMHQPPMAQPPMAHHAAPQEGYYPPQHAQYQYQQYQQHPQHQYPQYQHPQYNQYQYNQQYRGYANYATAPPPPPPPQHQSHNHHNHNINQHSRGQNGHSTNADAAASLRQSLPADASQKAKPKKVNPKMAKKYAGRGLKTITVSGPGMPTQRFKICVGNHPDDVRKWIEERKKRFPRSGGGNSADSGDVLGGKRMRDEGREGVSTSQKRACLDEKGKDGDATKAEGLSSLLAGYDSSSSEGEVGEPKAATEDHSRKELASAELQSPVGENGGVPEQQLQSKRLCRYYQRGKCRHGSSCKFLHSDAATTPEEKQRRRETQSERDRARNRQDRELRALGLTAPSHGSRYTSGGKTMDSSSLLQRLLQRDKEREHWLTLQLLRYIVDNNYFQSEKAGELRNGEDADAKEAAGTE